MASPPASPYSYQFGGALPLESPTYVRRKADDEFYQALKAGEFCYVLNSRQMGKSSLRVQTMRRLQQDGIACVAIDITSIGNLEVTPEQWYAGIIDGIADSLNLYHQFDLESWWTSLRFLSPVRRLEKFLESVLLRLVTQKIVVFIDEIDSVLSLNFSLDDFFAAIRDCYNSRADKTDFRRLTFALIGVATPSDLIQDKRRTPFNIGRAIELTGFQLEEALHLSQGFADRVRDPRSVMGAILDWTGGQPFLTQKLCNQVARWGSPETEFPIAAPPKALLDRIVQSGIITNWESQDEPEHLRTIRDRLLRLGLRTAQLLRLYKQILQVGEIKADDSPESMELQISGLVLKQFGKLRVCNRIYAAVFDLAWVNYALASLRPPAYGEALAAWFASGCRDDTHLLQGQVLREAQKWATDRNLSIEDYQFLNASQELEQRQLTEVIEAFAQRVDRDRPATQPDQDSLLIALTQILEKTTLQSSSNSESGPASYSPDWGHWTDVMGAPIVQDDQPGSPGNRSPSPEKVDFSSFDDRFVADLGDVSAGGSLEHSSLELEDVANDTLFYNDGLESGTDLILEIAEATIEAESRPSADLEKNNQLVQSRFAALLAPLNPLTFQFKQVVSDVEEKLRVVNQTLSMLDIQGFDLILVEIFSSITFKIAELLSADRAAIFLFDDATNELYSIVPQGGSGALDIRIPADRGIAGEVATFKHKVNIPFDFYDDPRSTLAQQTEDQIGYRTYTMMALPLLDEQNSLIAVVQLINKLQPQAGPSIPLSQCIDPAGFTEEDEQVFQEFAPSILLTLEASRSLYAVAQKQRSTNALIAATEALGQSNLDLDNTMQRVMDEAKQLMNVDRSTLWLIDAAGQNIWTKIPVQDGSLKELRLPLGVGFAGQVAASGEVFNIPFDLYNHPGSETAQTADQRASYRTCNLLCMPICNPEGQLIGVMQLVNKRKQGDHPPYDPKDWPAAPECWKVSFSDLDQEFMETFNTQAGVVLQNALQFERIRQQEQLQRMVLQHSPYGLIAVDLQGQILLANVRVAHLLGFTSPEELTGKNIHTVIHIAGEDFTRWFSLALTHNHDPSQLQYYPDRILQFGAGKKQSRINLALAPIAEPKDPQQITGFLVTIDPTYQR
ncbi:hypothetical protein BST81_07795 [Leptolyngbya sp. 'hensonii']|nr:hypothetical protein BST81_07795 [Leptolyngbya sp. 'hensonii']